MLDQIFGLEEKITLESVENIIGRVGFKKTSQMAELLFNNDLQKALSHLAKINEEGYNLVQFNKDLIHYLRRVLALKFSSALESEFKKELIEAELQAVKKHSQMLGSPADEQKTVNLIKSLIRAYTEMRYSPFVIVPLEVAIIENLKK